MENTCQYCKNLPGCDYLRGDRGKFTPERIITAENFHDCRGFEVVGDREKRGVRERLYAMSGLGYLRALHELPDLVMRGLRQGEKDELMYEDIPDFQDQKLLYPGMTSDAREEVLRYQTDENGNVVQVTDEEGEVHRLARPAYHLKRYAADENGPIKLDKSVCWFWSTNQLIDHIIKTEAKEGLITKDKKGAAKATPKPPAEQERETKMPEGKRVRVTRDGNSGGGKPQQQRRAVPKTAGPRPGGRVARAPVNKPEGAEEPKGGNGSEAAASNEMLEEMVERVVNKVLDARFGKGGPGFAELSAKLDQVVQTVIDVATIQHDIWAQTGGSGQYPQEDESGNLILDENGNEVWSNSPCLFNAPSKIFAYVDGTIDQVIAEQEQQEQQGGN